MRIAALYDIHGNISALEAVLHEISADQVDAVVIGGDVVWGPHPRAAIECLAEIDLPVTFIRGNADREVSEGIVSNDTGESSDPDVFLQITDWCRQQLSARQRNWIGSQSLTATLVTESLGETLFCHASPRSDEEIITTATPEKRFLQALSSVPEITVVCGHTHMQFDRTVQGRRLVNAGSVGMPYEGKQGAYWAMLGPDVEFRRSAYDVEEAAARMRGSGCPHVEEVFIDTIMNPPGRSDTIRHFEERATTALLRWQDPTGSSD
jgi:predicted phosphodiesterase